MTTKSSLLIEMWAEARSRFSNQLDQLNEDDLRLRLLPAQNSIGFLVRHIGDVELLFAKNVFGASDVKVQAKTVIANKDTGEWTNLAELQEYLSESFQKLKEIVGKQSDQDWSTTINTKEFGSKTKAEAFGRIVSHTAYHAGQIAIIRKYGS
jgi:uncharacterized damage-inducible protein DinB